MGKRGKLIVLEGIDGSGKATQLEELIKYLKTRKVSYTTYDFPRYETSFWGKHVGRYLAGEFGEVSNPYLATLPYILDQADGSKGIEKDLQQGKYVICNRFTTSNILFQTAYFTKQSDKDDFIDWLKLAAFKELGIIKPDLVICLHVDPKLSNDLVMKKKKRKYLGNKRKDIHEKNQNLQINASKEMIAMAKKDKTWKVINCNSVNGLRSIKEIANDVKLLVDKILQS